MKLLLRQSVTEPRGKLETSISPTLRAHRESHSSKFLQTFPWFISVYDCKDKYTWSIVVNTWSHPHSSHPLSFFPIALSLSLSSLCFCKTSKTYLAFISSYHLDDYWSYRFNSLDNINLLNILSASSRCFSANALSSKRVS